MLPFVELPRPLQDRSYQEPAKPIKTEDLALRKEVGPERLKDSMPDLEKALKSYAIDEYYGKSFELVLSGKARDAFDLTKEPDKTRERYGLTTFRSGTAFAPAD